MSTSRGPHARSHERADASRAERVQPGFKKSKGQNSGLAGHSGAGPSNAPQRDIERRHLPGSVQVIPPPSFRTGSHSQIPITPPQSSTDTITKDSGDNVLEGKVQDQLQVTAVQEGAQKGKQKQRDEPEVKELITQLNQARDKSKSLENEIEEKDKRITQLEQEARIARDNHITASGRTEAESFREQYERLLELCHEQEREKEELQAQLKKSRAEVKTLEYALQDSHEENRSLKRRLGLLHDELHYVYNTRNRAGSPPSAGSEPAQTNNEQSAATAEEKHEEHPAEENVPRPAFPCPNLIRYLACAERQRFQHVAKTAT